MDLENKNNHAAIKRAEDTEKAEALLKIINDYRVYATRFETLPTWDIIEWLSKLEKEVTDRYNSAIFDGERDRLKNEYFYLTGKRPFGAWSNEELEKRIADYKAGGRVESESALKSKKSRWKKAMS